MDSIPSEVDIIVVGGGAAGCVLAGRLAKCTPSQQILLLESGSSNLNVPTIRTPAFFLSNLHPQSTTITRYATAYNLVTGRKHEVQVGNVVGGGSSVNFMMYTRGSKSDYDDWKTQGWGFEGLKPLFKKTEKYHVKQGDDNHGYEGPVNVSHGGSTFRIANDYTDTFSKYAGVGVTEDVNDFETVNKVGKWPKWINSDTGMRSDAAHAFIHPVATQGNLHVLTESKCIRVLFDGTKAVGVEYSKTNESTLSFVVQARKMIILSAGSLSTPQILERSGIGSSTLLSQFSIPIISPLPGVGENYQDHHIVMKPQICRINATDDDTGDILMQQSPEYLSRASEIFAQGKGPLACNFIDAGIKYRPTEEEVKQMGPEMEKLWDMEFKDKPDKALFWMGVTQIRFLADVDGSGNPLLPEGKYISMGAYLNYPQSRGSIHITSKDPSVPPEFDAGFLSEEVDIQPQILAYKKNREIVRRMKCFIEEYEPSRPPFAADSPALGKSADEIMDFEYSEEDNKAIAQWVKNGIETTWHSMGTCAMKARDEGGVVDPSLNVYGTQNLKVADLSICPGNVGANTYSTALVIGEKAAMIISEELGLQGV